MSDAGFGCVPVEEILMIRYVEQEHYAGIFNWAGRGVRFWASGRIWANIYYRLQVIVTAKYPSDPLSWCHCFLPVCISTPRVLVNSNWSRRRNTGESPALGVPRYWPCWYALLPHIV